MISHLYGSHYFLATEFAPRSQRIDLLGVPPSSARCCLGARWRGLTRRTHTAPTIPPRGSATQPGPQHTCSPQVCRPASAASPRKAVYYGASPHRRHHRRVRNRVPRRRRRIGTGILGIQQCPWHCGCHNSFETFECFLVLTFSDSILKLSSVPARSAERIRGRALPPDPRGPSERSLA